MRNNQPVTGKVYAFPGDQTLISVTDLKGRITYCNTNFVSVSGYNREELLGQPHNIVRHPDMPEEAFRDLWETIEGGRPWSAIVKNRRKSGDHYWVRANATPVRSGDRIVGYLSVRTQPSEAEVAAADELYALMRSELAAGRLIHRLKNGEVYRDTFLGRLIFRLRPGITSMLGILFLLATLMPVAVSAMGASVAATVLAALVASGLATFLAWRSTIQPLDGVLEEANRLAAGDLAKGVDVTRSGMIGRLQLALAQMAVSVRTVVRDVRHEVANLRGGSQEIATGNQDMSSRTESQATSLEQTALSMERINEAIRETTQLTQQGANLAVDAADISRRSHEAVQAVAETMEGIARSSDKIGNIIQVIDGLAFQTNILALNAAVEAAHAGDQGRGFAVVASEVRALAGRTSTAAREIKELIEESIERVKTGSRQTSHAQARMEEAKVSVERTAALLEQIRTATVAQEVSVAQINDAVTNLDSLTQQNAAMVEELAAAAKSMDDQVGMVHGSIRVFRLTSRDVTLAEADAVALRKQYHRDDGEIMEINYDEAIAAHQQWRVTLRNAVLKGTRLNVAELRRDDCCTLGRWIHGRGGSRWGHAPTFRHLVDTHRTFHIEAAKVAEVANQGRADQAAKMLDSGSSFNEAGKGVTLALRAMRLEQDAAASPSLPAPAASVSGGGSENDDWASF